MVSPLVRQTVPPAKAAGFSAVGAAMQVDEQVLGLMVLTHERGNRFGGEAKRLTEIFASQAAIIIENNDLYQRAQEQAWVSTALLQVAEATRQLQTLPEVLESVVRVAPLVAGVSACAIWLQDTVAPDAYHLANLYGFAEVDAQFGLAENLPLIIDEVVLEEGRATLQGTIR